MQYFQRHISAWMDGTEGLDDGEYRVYDVICNLIYLNEGPIVLHESGIAGRCNQHPLKFRRNFQKLVEKGKLIVGSDNKISNRRVCLELEKVTGRKRGKPADPPATPASPHGGTRGVAGGSPGGKADKPLKSKGGPLFDVGTDKTRQSTEANASAKPVRELTEIEIARKEIFDRGKRVLGDAAGGLIQRLLAAKHGNVALARAAIEQASTMDNPREYIGGILRGGFNGKAQGAIDPSRLGFAGLAAAARRGQEESGRPAPEDLQPINRR